MLVAADHFTIDPALPPVPGFPFHKRTGDGSLFHGTIADTEPDRWGRNVIGRDHAKHRESARASGATALTPVRGELDFLLAVHDVSRLGALPLRDEQIIFQASPREGRVGDGYQRYSNFDTCSAPRGQSI